MFESQVNVYHSGKQRNISQVSNYVLDVIIRACNDNGL